MTEQTWEEYAKTHLLRSTTKPVHDEAALAALPAGVRGIDGSHWKGGIDAAKVKAAGYSFVSWAAMDGTAYHDPTYHAAEAACKAAGLYFFGFQVGRLTTTGAIQWALFKGYANPPPGSLVCLDIERPGPSIDAARARDWCLAAKADGFRPVVYGCPADILYQAANALLWPTIICGPKPAQYTFWQSATAQVPGIWSNPTDIDEFNGTAADLAALFGGGEPDVPPTLADIAKLFGLTEGALAAAVQSGAGLSDAAAGRQDEPSNAARKAAVDYLKGLGGGGGGPVPAHTHTVTGTAK